MLLSTKAISVLLAFLTTFLIVEFLITGPSRPNGSLKLPNPTSHNNNTNVSSTSIIINNNNNINTTQNGNPIADNKDRSQIEEQPIKRDRSYKLPSYCDKIPENKPCPIYLIPGVMKGGTSAMWKYMSTHPNMVLSLVKELNYWTGIATDQQGISCQEKKEQLTVEKYIDMFFPNVTKDMCGGKRCVTGESTPGYFNSRCVLNLIPQVFPDIKIIIVLRNPVDRVFSHWGHNCRMKSDERYFNPSFDETIEMELKLLESCPYYKFGEITKDFKECLEWEFDVTKIRGYTAPIFDDEITIAQSILTNSFYIYNVERWMSVFGDNVMIVPSEVLYEETEKTMIQVYDFLEVSVESEELINRDLFDDVKETYKQQKEKKEKCQNLEKEMSNSTRKLLEGLYRPFNLKLFEKIGRKIQWYD
jgi:hypothetical protein